MPWCHVGITLGECAIGNAWGYHIPRTNTRERVKAPRTTVRRRYGVGQEAMGGKEKSEGARVSRGGRGPDAELLSTDPSVCDPK